MVDTHRLYQNTEEHILKITNKNTLDTIGINSINPLLDLKLLCESSLFTYNFLWKFRGK